MNGVQAWGFAAAIFAVGMAGGLLPLVRRWSDRALHLFVTVACGVFLGVVFLDLLPAVGQSALNQHSAWIWVLAGVVGVYVIEALFFRDAHQSEAHQHAIVSYAAFLGLCVHSLTAGLGLAAAGSDEDLAWPVFVSILLHKGAETTSLVTVFSLAHFPIRKTLVLLFAFALITPAGLLGGGYLMEGFQEQTFALVALAAGTFLYVVLCELLPEVFHRTGDRIGKVLLLLLGILVAIGIHEVAGEHDCDHTISGTEHP